MKSNKLESIEGNALMLVPQKFFEELLETQQNILNAVTGDNLKQEALGDYISEKEAKKIFGRKTTWFWSLRKSGKIPYSKVGNKIYYSKHDLQNLLKEETRK